MENATNKLNALIALWNDKRGARLMPSRDDLPAQTLRPWLGNLALIDLTGTAPTFRLCGTGLRARFGGEMTGQTLEAVQDAHGRSELNACITKARATLKPTQMKHEIRTESGKLRFHELCAPLAQDGRQIDMVLFASYAERKKGPVSA